MPVIKKSKALRPLWTTKDGETVRLYQGDVLDVLRQLPAKSVRRRCDLGNDHPSYYLPEWYIINIIKNNTP